MNEAIQQNHKWPLAVLAASLVLGALLRFSGLADNPPGVLLDEASIAYDAHLIGQTGLDERGARMPFYPQSTWNPKHPAYFYPMVLAVKLFGLNIVTARMLSAVFGLLGILAIYLLAVEITGDTRAGALSAVFLAASPWHVHFSRVAFEAVSMPAYFMFGAWFMLRALRGRGALMLPGAALICASFYAYPVALLFAPLFLAGAAVIHRKKLAAQRIWFAAAAAIITAAFIHAALVDFKGTGMDKYYSRESVSASTGAEAHGASRASASAKTWFYNYAAYFGPKYLFLKGDTSSLNHGTTKFGVLLLACAPLVLAGLIFAIRKRGPGELTILWWLLLYPAGASLMTPGQQHAIRSLIGAPVFQILSAIGVLALIGCFSSRARIALTAAVSTAVIAAVAVNSAAYFSYYFRQYPADAALNFNKGYDSAIMLAAREMREGRARSAALSDRTMLAYSYLFFYNPPSDAQLVRDPRTRALDVHATALRMGFDICDITKCLETLNMPAVAIARPGQLPPGIYKNKYSSGYFRIAGFAATGYPGKPPNYIVSRILPVRSR